MVVSKPYVAAPSRLRDRRSSRGTWRNWLRAASSVGVCVFAYGVSGCESRSVIAEWRCPRPSQFGAGAGAGSGGAASGGASTGDDDDAWQTSFENSFCDYDDEGGRCVVTGQASKRVVRSPVHSGEYSAEYTVAADGTDGGQARCFRLGGLPAEATYGAWYYIPEQIEVPTNGHWNLFHMQGGSGESEVGMPGLWDVTLVNKDDGSLRLTAYDFELKSGLPDLSQAPSVPIGEWFHVEMYLKRGADGTGAFALYQDGRAIVELSDVTTEYEDTVERQWYVGNLVGKNGPLESTVYVDDVSIVAAP